MKAGRRQGAGQVDRHRNTLIKRTILRKEKDILRGLLGFSDGQCNSLSPKKPVKIYIYLSDFVHWSHVAFLCCKSP